MSRQQEDILDRFIASLSLRGTLLHPATLFVLASVVLIGSAIFLWERHQHQIVDLEEYRLTKDKIQLSAPPQWAQADLKELIIQKSDKVQASILDTDLVGRTAAVMQKVGYVEHIKHVKKTKQGLDVDVIYRKPVATVELSEVTLREFWPKSSKGKTVKLPVDGHGVIMPEDLGTIEALPRIIVLYPKEFSKLATWESWPDQRIQEAAQISALLKGKTEQFGIDIVMTYRNPDQQSDANLAYQLWPASPKNVGVRIIWGNAPGKEVENEASAEAKIQAIENLVAQNGPLNKLRRRTIDVRTGNPAIVEKTKTASKSDLFEDLK